MPLDYADTVARYPSAVCVSSTLSGLRACIDAITPEATFQKLLSPYASVTSTRIFLLKQNIH